jgi:N-acetylmuramoyl-L-alanine amidase
MDLHDAGALNLLTGLLWGEARGEPIHGKIAVAWVVRNRMIDKRWPDTYEDVILQPLQFSCFNDDDPNRESVINHLFPSCGAWNDRDWRECRYAAEGVYDLWVQDLTKGANHYHTKQITPYWADSTKVTVIIENHIFYRL